MEEKKGWLRGKKCFFSHSCEKSGLDPCTRLASFHLCGKKINKPQGVERGTRLNRKLLVLETSVDFDPWLQTTPPLPPSPPPPLPLSGVPDGKRDPLGHQENVRGARVLPGGAGQGGPLQDQQGLLRVRRGGRLLPGLLLHGGHAAAAGEGALEGWADRHTHRGITCGGGERRLKALHSYDAFMRHQYYCTFIVHTCSISYKATVQCPVILDGLMNKQAINL